MRESPLELEEIADLEHDFIEELMQEPPHGHNHGRERGYGGWHPLETDPMDVPSFKRYVREPRKHGTEYAYRKLGCRCEKCRAWKSAQNAAYRQKKRDPGV